MSDEKLGGAHNPEAGFEQEDLSAVGVMYFMAGLAVVVVVIYFIVVGMYRYLDHYDRTHQPPANPMAADTNMDPQTMSRDQIRDKAEATFPKPVLEYSEQTQYIDELKKQNDVLTSYDFVDQKNGVVRIPIDRAMDILVQRGLPVLPPQGAGADGTTSANAPKASSSAGKGGASDKSAKAAAAPKK